MTGQIDNRSAPCSDNIGLHSVSDLHWPLLTLHPVQYHLARENSDGKGSVSTNIVTIDGAVLTAHLKLLLSGQQSQAGHNSLKGLKNGSWNVGKHSGLVRALWQMMGWDFSSTLEIKMSDSVAAAAAISQTESEKRRKVWDWDNQDCQSLTERKYKSRPWHHTPTDQMTAPAGAAAGVWTGRDTAGSNEVEFGDVQNPLQCAKLQLLHSHRVDTLQGQQGLNLQKY